MSGKVRKPLLPLPLAYLNVRRVNVQAIANNLETIVQFDTVVYQRDINYNAGTFTATITNTGIYQISSCLAFAAAAAGVREVQIWVNGGRLYFIPAPVVVAGHSNYPYVLTSPHTYLFQGDTIQIKTYQNSGAALNLGFSGRNPEFSVIRLDDLP